MLGILAVCCEIIYNILPQLVTCLLTLITVFLVMLLLLLSHFSRVQLCVRRSPPGSPVPGILQARTLEWVAISFSNA